MPELFPWLLLGLVPSKRLITDRHVTAELSKLELKFIDLTRNTHTNVKAATEHFPQILQAKFQCISTDKSRCLSTPVKAGIILRSRPCPSWNMPHWKAVILFFNATSFNRLLLYLLCFLRSSSSFRHTWWFCSSHLKLVGRDSAFSCSQAHTKAPGIKTLNLCLLQGLGSP